MKTFLQVSWLLLIQFIYLLILAWTDNTDPAVDHVPDLNTSTGAYTLLALCSFMELIIPTAEVTREELDLSHISLFVEARRRTRELVAWYDKTHQFSNDGDLHTFYQMGVICQADQVFKGIREWDSNRPEEKDKKKTRARSTQKASSRAMAFFLSLRDCYDPDGHPFWQSWEVLKDMNESLLMWEEKAIKVTSRGTVAIGE